MNVMRYNLFLPCITLVIVFTYCQGCGKAGLGGSKKDNPDTLKFTKNAFDYVNMPYSKHFIYKDSATAQTDSVVVTKNQLEDYFMEERGAGDWYFGGTVPSYYYEHFNLILTKCEGAVRTEWFNGNADAGSITGICDTASMHLQNISTFFSIAFSLSEMDSPANSIAVEGITYNNVVITSHNNGLDPLDQHYYKTTFYWAKGVGLIKTQLIHTNAPSKTYTLLRHN